MKLMFCDLDKKEMFYKMHKNKKDNNSDHLFVMYITSIHMYNEEKIYI